MNRQRCLLLMLVLSQFASPLSAQNRSADSLLRLVPSAKEEDQASLYNAVAAQYRQSDPDKNLQYAGMALDLAKKFGNEKEEGFAYSSIGYGWYIKGDYGKATDYTGKAVLIGQKIDDKKLLGACYNALGLINQNSGSMDKALDNFLLALHYREAISDSSGMAATNNNVGEVYRIFSRYPKALEHLHKAEQLYKAINNKNGLGSVYSNMGAVYFQMNEIGSAIFYFDRAVSLRKETHNRRGLAVVLSNLAEVYSKSHDWAKALECVREAIRISSEAGDPLLYITSMTTLAGVYAGMDSIESARKTISLALDSARKLDIRTQLQSTEEAYAEIMHRIGRDGEAYSSLKQSMDLKDSIFTNETSQKINSLQEQMDREKLEAELRLKEESEKREKIVLILGIVLLLVAAGFLFNRYRLKNKANLKLEEQNKIIALKNKEISDSIDYAKKIQRAILPLTRDLEKVFPSGFGIYSPKDIVSGDFYWFVEHRQKFFIAAADCTGHGVPGAFMSLLGTAKLTHAVKDKDLLHPSEILRELNKEIKETLKQKEAHSELRDGMDIALCCYDFKNQTVEYSGANRPLYHISGGKLQVFPATKAAIGGLTSDDQEYENHSIAMKTGDNFYVFTDGITDQFGGEKGKKFSSKRLRETLLSLQEMKMNEQEKELVKILEAWMEPAGMKYDQVDDILLIGIRI